IEGVARNNGKTPGVKPGPGVAPDNKVVPSPSELVDNNNKTLPDPIKSPNETLPTRPGSSDAEVVAYINHELQESWQEHGVKPAGVATDAEWCRRTYPRLIGRIPTIDELQAF